MTCRGLVAQVSAGPAPRARRAYASPRRAQQAAETRAAVLAAAVALFAEKGWVATGVRDVAKAARRGGDGRQ